MAKILYGIVFSVKCAVLALNLKMVKSRPKAAPQAAPSVSSLKIWSQTLNSQSVIFLDFIFFFKPSHYEFGSLEPTTGLIALAC